MDRGLRRRHPIDYLLAPLLLCFSAGCISTPAPRARPALLVPASQTIMMEHRDRISRFRRLRVKLARQEAPDLETDVVAVGSKHGTQMRVPVLRVRFPNRVFFDTNSAKLRREASPVLDLVAAVLKRDPPDVPVAVAGHTDDVGPAAYNLELSLKRAREVARALQARGVEANRIWTVGFGEALPLRPNTTVENRALNRRVEFQIAAVPEAIALRFLSDHKHPCVTGNDPRGRICPSAVNLERLRPTSVVANGVPIPLADPQPGGVTIEGPALTQIRIDLKEHTISAPSPVP